MSEIATMYIQHVKPDDALMLKFIPAMGALWRGVGRCVDQRNSYCETLDQVGQELLELIGKHHQVAAVELLSVEHTHHAEGLMFIQPLPGVSMQQLANTIGLVVARYYQCSIQQEGYITES